MRKIIPPRRENNFNKIPPLPHNGNFLQEKMLVYMSLKFRRLTEISPTADRHLSQAGKYFLM